MNDYFSFTQKNSDIISSVQTSVSIYPHGEKEKQESTLWRATWDTGATNSCISQRIVDALRLSPTGQVQISAANGYATVNTYYVDIYLPNGFLVNGVNAFCVNLDVEDALIGMDVITLGDFAITNLNQKTTFSFVVPSYREIDYDQELQ